MSARMRTRLRAMGPAERRPSLTPTRTSISSCARSRRSLARRRSSSPRRPYRSASACWIAAPSGPSFRCRVRALGRPDRRRSPPRASPATHGIVARSPTSDGRDQRSRSGRAQSSVSRSWGVRSAISAPCRSIRSASRGQSSAQCRSGRPRPALRRDGRDRRRRPGGTIRTCRARRPRPEAASPGSRGPRGVANRNHPSSASETRDGSSIKRENASSDQESPTISRRRRASNASNRAARRASICIDGSSVRYAARAASPSCSRLSLSVCV